MAEGEGCLLIDGAAGVIPTPACSYRVAVWTTAPPAPWRGSLTLDSLAGASNVIRHAGTTTSRSFVVTSAPPCKARAEHQADRPRVPAPAGAPLAPGWRGPPPADRPPQHRVCADQTARRRRPGQAAGPSPAVDARCAN